MTVSEVYTYNRKCVKENTSPSVSQLVLREHCPLSCSREDNCSSDLLNFPMLPQGELRGDSPPYE